MIQTKLKAHEQRPTGIHKATYTASIEHNGRQYETDFVVKCVPKRNNRQCGHFELSAAELALAQLVRKVKQADSDFELPRIDLTLSRLSNQCRAEFQKNGLYGLYGFCEEVPHTPLESKAITKLAKKIERAVRKEKVVLDDEPKPPRKRKKVVCISTGETFASVDEAAAKVSCALDTMYACLRGKRKTVHKLEFRYA